MLTKFYWGTVRKAVITFGNIFNNILIDRLNADGTVAQTIKVPLGYASRQKFLARIAAIKDDNVTQEVVVPRMSFEMTGINYDVSRKRNIVMQNRAFDGNSASLQQYTPVPWNINMSLYIYTKNQDDGLQIIEQILPYFNPDFNVKLNAMKSLGVANDLPVVLNSIDYDDQFEGSFEDHRKIFWTLNFTLKLDFYGPLNRQGVIKKVTENTVIQSNSGNANVIYTATVDPFTANVSDDYDIIETFEEF